jgi:uncharacterized ParB-like nuclease family protein
MGIGDPMAQGMVQRELRCTGIDHRVTPTLPLPVVAQRSNGQPTYYGVGSREPRKEANDGSGVGSSAGVLKTDPGIGVIIAIIVFSLGGERCHRDAAHEEESRKGNKEGSLDHRRVSTVDSRGAIRRPLIRVG